MTKPAHHTPSFDVLAIADLCMDIVIASSSRPEFGQVELLADHYELDLGGSVGIFATQFAKLGGAIALVGKTGNDAAAQIVHNRLTEAGVDLRYVESVAGQKTAMGLNLAVGDDRAMLAYLGTMDLIRPELWQDDWPGLAKHWHIASYFLLERLIPVWPEWADRLKQQGVTLSLDTNWAPLGNWKSVLELLPLMDVFLPNLAEALAITGEHNLADAGKKLVQSCPLVVVKCGADGAAVFQDGTMQLFRVPEEISRSLAIADTTGAGDNFDAGFIYHWLKGADLATCVSEACRCAVSSLGKLGGIAGQIDRRTNQ